MNNPVGRTILHYKILEQAGQGGMGVVYKAEDSRLKRIVALKFLPHYISSSEERKRFEIEAQAAASLNHPNISTIYSIEESDNETFIVQEYIEGIELKERIKSSPLSVDDALNIALQIAEGLQAAHSKGIIHRDIKSSNIMITQNGIAKIMDFGLSKIGQGAEVTKIGSVLGTAAYMSPEQIQGGEVNHRTDIWSFGIVMYEMLTAQLPFKGDYNQAYFYSILNEDPQPAAAFRNDVPAEFQEIIFKALSKNQAERYQNVSDLITELKKINRHYGSVEVKPKARTINRKAYLIFGLILLTLLILALLFRNSFKTDTDETKRLEVKKLAIIPFINIRNDPETNFLGFALADQIIGSLAYVSNILVRPSSAVRQYENKSIDPASAGSRLNVDFILTGSYLKESGIVRLNLELIDIHNNEIIWRDDFDVKYDNTFRLQEIVSEKVTKGLKVKFTADERVTDTPGNPLAYEYFLRAISYPYTNKDSHFSISMLKKSLELDSEYAPVYSELGFRYNLLSQYDIEGTGMREKAEASYKKALYINPELLSALGNLAGYYAEAGRSIEAVRLIKKALNINPNNPEAHFWLGYIYRYTGPLNMAVKEMETAVKLDSANPRFRSIGITYFYLEQYEEALKGFDLDKESPYSIGWKGAVYFRMNKKDLSKEYLKKAISLEPNSVIGIWAKAVLYFFDGDKEEGLKALNLLEAFGKHDAEQAYNFSGIYGLYGQNEGCIRLLESAITEGFYNYQLIENDPYYYSVRNESRFKELVADAKIKHEEFIKKLNDDSLSE